MSEHIPLYDIGAAVVGAGFIGPVHAEALKRLGVRVVGIAGISPDEADAARRSLGLAKGYRSYDDLLNDADVDAVHIATPNVHHFQMARDALQAGKHVMCEKPLAMTSSESAALVELAESKDLAAGVCYNIRFYPLNLEARSRVAAGELGDIFAANGSYVQDWLMYDTDYNWRVLAEAGGELRAVADIGTHWMDLVSSVTGRRIESVFADLVTFHKTRKRPMGEVETFTGKAAAPVETEEIPVTTEDYGAILLRLEGGARGTLYVSQVSAGRKNRLQYEISGSKAALAWDSQAPNDLWIGHRNQPNQIVPKDPSLLGDLARPYANFPGGHNEGFPDAVKQCFRSFYTAISSGEPKKGVYPNFAEGHQEILLCEAILESHRSQRWVNVG